MKRIGLIVLIFTISIIGCDTSQKSNNELPLGKITERQLCDADTTQSYSIYVPKKYDEQKSYPVVYAFDSHGKGIAPVKKYKNITPLYSSSSLLQQQDHHHSLR